MTTKYFKCTLLTDVVLNASLATEGNMESLDFIPGSNFLGIVAKKLYTTSNNETLDIFHSEKVKFGDALISKNGKISYALPFSLFQDKLENKITDNKVWVHHRLAELDKDKMPKNANGDFRQLKQNRKGYFFKENDENIYIDKVKKGFSLKSAYDANERRSKDAAMFGFDGITKGQEFIFSVVFEDETYLEQVKNALIGTKQLGKSKTAQYGQVKIELLENGKEPKPFLSGKSEKNQLVIYAESRLCFLNEFGSPTFQPKPCDFGIEGKDLEFAWAKCQIRTNSYSPWNAKRNTPDSQRNFFERGSVFVIENPGSTDIDNLPKIVGEYQNEGFGRVIYNPEFLKYKEDGVWDYTLTDIFKPNTNSPNQAPVESLLGQMLLAKSEADKMDLKIGKKILDIFTDDERNGKVLLSDKITKSQWGNIRSIATQAMDIAEINKNLFDKEIGYLTHGVAYEKIWGKSNEKRLNALKSVIYQNKELGTQFVAKFAAEIAKKN